MAHRAIFPIHVLEIVAAKTVEMKMRTLDSFTQYDDADGNSISGNATSSNSKVIFRGNQCKLVIGDNVKIENTTITFYCDNSTISIGSGSTFKGQILLGLECNIEIGKKLTVTRNCYISAAETASIRIGDDCMFAKNIEIRADDAHPIYEISSGKRVNPSRDIAIGNKVWLAEHTCVLSGTSIGCGTVVGTRSLVKGTFPPSSMIAGVPAKLLKEGIRWERTHLSQTPPYDFR